MREIGLEVEGDWWTVARFFLNTGVLSYSVDDRPLVSKPLLDANYRDVSSLRWAIEPNNFCHVSSDAALSINVEPLGPQRTKANAKFLVHKEAVDGMDCDRARLIHVWNLTNRQDRDLAENNQRGINGLGYVPAYLQKVDVPVNSFVD